MLLTNCRIYQKPNADAILCEDGRIKAIGSSSEYKADVVIDLHGGYVYPGFTDAHLHLAGLGLSLDILNLVGTASAAEIVKIIAETVETFQGTSPEAGKRTWIEGRGWDQNDWPVPDYPTKEMLDAVAPNRPVYLRRIDGHAAWVNSHVLEIADISADTPDPNGGKILRDEWGEPTGILIDNAVDLITAYIPVAAKEDKRRQVLKTIKLLNSLGITAIHDAGTDLETIAILKELIAENQLTLRIYTMLNNNPEDYAAYLGTGPEIENSFLQVRALKLYLDGALGSRGAALLAPYADDPRNHGLILTDSSAVAQQVQQFNVAGFQVCIHCIGDRANRMALNIFEKLQKSIPGDHRNRIEHAQIVHPNDIPRFAVLGVLPSMQPTHCTSDMYWVDERLGERRLNEAYPWQSLINAGSIIPGGSDAPVEYPDPLAGIYAAVTRQDQQGWPAGGWLPDERLTIDQAINMFTIWPAFAAFQERVKGKIQPGFYADFTVLSDNLEAVSQQGLLNIDVLYTIVNGKVVFSSDK